MASDKIFKFKKTFSIGSLEAERDTLLLKSFVNKEELDVFIDTNSTQSIVLGRTGIGKSAMILWILEKEDNVLSISPESLSIKYLSNSNIIKHFQSIGVNLTLFYKVLWKHIFIVELLKIYLGDDDEASGNILQWFKNKMSDNTKKRQKAIDYLETWKDDFWKTGEHRVKERTTNLHEEFEAKIKGDASLYKLFKATIEGSGKFIEKDEIKTEYIYRAQQVISQNQPEEIKEIMEIMRTDFFPKQKKKFYLTIDNLDTDWVDKDIVNDLIATLIYTINEFSNIPNVKIIIALRNDVYRRIFETNRFGNQREKYKHLFEEIIWSEEEIKNLINKRLEFMMKGGYTNENPKIEDVLPTRKGNTGVDGFQYILDRTLFRPRDVIDFFNLCIKSAAGSTKITLTHIKLAEKEYSESRLQALVDEWESNYGNLKYMWSFLKQYSNGSTFEEFTVLASCHYEELLEKGNYRHINLDTITTLNSYKDDEVVLSKKILIILYNIGLVGIKVNPESKVQYVHGIHNSLDEADITSTSKVYVHKMYNMAFRIITYNY